MWLRRPAQILFALFLLLPFPALIAPHVSDDPVAWAYRVYHPFMYRYPAVFGAHINLDLQARSKLGQSLEVARLMIEHW
ncbi:MAG TPA: hypothetical protein VM120_13100 [Bryobacteraceae bacterium]|nr:hypothetical protein [Bryobacteraceae bacterium]